MFLKWFLVNIAQIWFGFKRITTGNDVLKWSHVYFKAPFGSEREKLAFKRAIELWAIKNPEILKIYPDYSPPNILRKIAFNKMYIYLHGCIAIAFFESMDICGDGKLSEHAKREINSYKEKYSLWAAFFLSKPDSEDEGISLQKLITKGEIFPKTIFRNYLITIE